MANEGYLIGPGPCRPGDPDAESVARALAGEAAFADIVAKYRGALVFKAGKSLHNRAEAEDAASKSLDTAYRKLPQFRGEAAFTSWLFEILKNEVIRRWKRQASAQDKETSLGDLPEHGPTDVAVEWPTLAQNSEKHRRYVGLVSDIENALPRQQSRVCNLVMLAGLGESEVGEVLSMRVDAVRMNLMRGKATLKDLHRQHEGHA